jgi:hypothetical protein
MTRRWQLRLVRALMVLLPCADFSLQQAMEAWGAATEAICQSRSSGFAKL